MHTLPTFTAWPQVVIQAGASPGATVNVALSDSPAFGSGADCATGVSVAAADVAVACPATGRYLTVYSADNTSPMVLCRCALGPTRGWARSRQSGSG